MTPLSNKIALVTGGSRGIGAATAKALAEAGATVAISYHSSADRADAVVQDIKSAGGEAAAFQADSGSADGPTKLVDAVVAKFGQLDILVNNAGVIAYGSIAEIGPEVYRQNFDVNVGGVYETTRVAVPQMNDNGRIISIGSSISNRAFPGTSAYAGTKAALAGITRGWAKDLAGRGITANVIHPGSINTEMNPDHADNPSAEMQKGITALGRYGKPEDIANAVLFLADPKANFVTGSELFVDGGFTA